MRSIQFSKNSAFQPLSAHNRTPSQQQPMSQQYQAGTPSFYQSISPNEMLPPSYYGNGFGASFMQRAQNLNYNMAQQAPYNYGPADSMLFDSPVTVPKQVVLQQNKIVQHNGAGNVYNPQV